MGRLISFAQRQVASKVADVLHRVLLPVAPKFERDEDGGEEKKSANSVNLKQSRLVGAIGFESILKRSLNKMQARGWHQRP